MTAEVLPIRKAKPTWEPVLDSRDRPIPGFRRYVRSGVIYYRETFKKLGIPEFNQSTEETTIGRAKTKAQVMVQRWKNKHLGIDDSKVYGRSRADFDRTVQAVAAWVLEHVTPSRRPATRWKHHYYIGLIVEEFGSYGMDAVTIEMFKVWIMKLRNRKFGTKAEKGARGWREPRLRRSFEDFAKHMNILWREAYGRRLSSHLIVFPNPDRVLISTRKERARRYSDAELTLLWNVLSEDLRDQFVLAAECYMRLREALKLEWDRIDIKTGRVTLRAEDVKTGSKTGRGREFILSPMACERIRARHASRNPRSPYVFPGRINPMKPRTENRSAWRRAKDLAGITGRATWHHLRHTALSKALLESEAPAVKVSEYAGVSLSTIQRTYLHARAEETAEAGVAAQLPIQGGKAVEKSPAVKHKSVKSRRKNV